MEDMTTRPMTFGEMLVGVDFNPSGDPKVNRVKQLCAELADIVQDNLTSKGHSQLSVGIHQNAFSEILNGQMNIVKAITFKY